MSITQSFQERVLRPGLPDRDIKDYGRMMLATGAALSVSGALVDVATEGWVELGGKVGWAIGAGYIAVGGAVSAYERLTR